MSRPQAVDSGESRWGEWGDWGQRRDYNSSGNRRTWWESEWEGEKDSGDNRNWTQWAGDNSGERCNSWQDNDNSGGRNRVWRNPDLQFERTPRDTCLMWEEVWTELDDGRWEREWSASAGGGAQAHAGDPAATPGAAAGGHRAPAALRGATIAPTKENRLPRRWRSRRRERRTATVSAAARAAIGHGAIGQNGTQGGVGGGKTASVAGSQLVP